MKNIAKPKAFPLECDFVEGDEFTSELMQHKVVMDTEELRTFLSMLEPDSPKIEHGHRTVWFRTQGHMLEFSLNSDCQTNRDRIIEHIDERVGL